MSTVPKAEVLQGRPCALFAPAGSEKALAVEAQSSEHMASIIPRLFTREA